jgi:hypothetical protein
MQNMDDAVNWTSVVLRSRRSRDDMFHICCMLTSWTDIAVQRAKRIKNRRAVTEKSIVIVGAGIAELSTGCYARMNGYKTTILEMHNMPGGLCTAWKRKGYTFDISMHFLVSSKAGRLHQMWRELGMVNGDQRFHYHDEVVRVESGGKKLELLYRPSAAGGADACPIAGRCQAHEKVHTPVNRQEHVGCYVAQAAGDGWIPRQSQEAGGCFAANGETSASTES